MADRVRCTCRRCTLRGFLWPAILITLGLLFLVDKWNTNYGFHETWPVLLIVIGAVKLGQALVSSEGHITQ
jgi:hypothetical protein